MEDELSKALVVSVSDQYFARGGSGWLRKAYYVSQNGDGSLGIDTGWAEERLAGGLVEVAIKCRHDFADEDEKIKSTEREIRVLQTLRHPNITPYLGIWYDPADKWHIPCPVSIFYANGNVSQYLKNFPKANKLWLLVGTGAGIDFIHASGVVHGDIKSDNILVDDQGNARICDFGISQILDQKGFTTNNLKGTFKYMAPEILVSPVGEERFQPTKSSDSWSLCMTAFEISAGKRPFFGLNQPQAIVAILRGEMPARPDDASLDDCFWSLLCKGWNENPDLRPSSRVVSLFFDLLYAIQHVKRYDINETKHSEAGLKGLLEMLLPILVEGSIFKEELVPIGPYRCKWPACGLFFYSMQDCIKHELGTLCRLAESRDCSDKDILSSFTCSM